ncbi:MULTISPECIES: enoyl-CoA hydratase/isomerase family protein [Aeromicrobium]|uniref:enoyl-CoA hydratase/isomerase family protein n=1 Tax=Aeromicrobium TaxID=2040 RepID=UPI00257A6130|nr:MULTISPECIES: enoyl-CoA hydratase/isomerase family protein [Aeromicrobium]
MTMLTNHDGPVWTLNLGDNENRFSPDLLAQAVEDLRGLAEGTEPAVLVTTGTGKFFSNGLDLEWLSQHPDELNAYVDRVHGLFAAVLTLPVPTIAAINGHAFGAGSMLAMAHDFRVMREDRGYFCFPEVDIHIPFTEGMAALIQAKVTPSAAVESMTTGRRYDGPAAQASGIVDAVAPQDTLVETAAARVAPLAGKDRATLGKIKQVMYAAAIEALKPRAS